MLDGRALYDWNRFRGIGVYLRGLTQELGRMPGLTVSALVKPGTALPAGVSPRLTVRVAPGRFAAQEHEVLLPLDLLRGGFDVFHSPSQEPPRNCHRPWVQTLHAVDDHPALAAERRRWERLAPRIRGAAAVVVTTEYAAEGVTRLLALDAARVHVAPPGVDAAFQPGTGAPSDPPSILMVGEFGPWKGYAEAFACIARLADAGYPHHLAVAGKLAPWTQPEVERLRQESGRPERIDLLGFVEHRELPALYHRADVALLPSRCEAFGFPAVEAMAAGVPLVAFSNTALPEVVGDGGELVADGDVDAMVTAVRGLLDSPARRAEAVERGVARARRYDWSRCAAMHAALYREVAAA
jgi:glycosyltransferase involved in cell wall biosynthesis